jgi:hypothetical protein
MAQMAHAYREKRDSTGPPVSPNRAVGGGSGFGHEPDPRRPAGQVPEFACPGRAGGGLVSRIVRDPPAGARQGVRDVQQSDGVPIRPLAIVHVAKGRSVSWWKEHCLRWGARHSRPVAGVAREPFAPTRLRVSGGANSLESDERGSLITAADHAVRSRYEIRWPFVVISLRLLMPFRNFSGPVIL